jgi:iduronate 2-sulfatase
MILVSSCTSGNRVEEAAQQPPNILFIAVDDLRTELNCYGDDHIISPNIDRLAREGLLFSRAYCQVPVCGASRASLLSGLRPNNNRFWDYMSHVDEDAPGTITLPQVFRENGYYTVSNGKIFHGTEDSNERSWTEPAWKPDQDGRKMLDPESGNFIGGLRNRGPFFESPDVPDNAYVDGQIAEKTISDLKRLSKKEEPFFLAVGFIKPHLPFYAPKKYWDLYDPEAIDIAENRDRPLNAPESLKASEEILYYHDRDIEYNSDAFHRVARHGYYACVSYVDAQIGKVMATLDSLDLHENTIVVLWGDHGWNLGEHDFWSKHNTMHNSLHAPLIFSVPGKGRKQSSARLVEFIDIYPTLCELAGIEKPDHLDGTSLVALFSDPDQEWKQAVFPKYQEGDAVITDRYSFTRYTLEGRKEYMLYDLQTDPEENVNLAGDVSHRTVLESMDEMLDEMINRTQ